MTVVEWLTYALDAMFLLAGLAASRLWWRHRSPATAWLLATFAIFSLLILTTLVESEAMETGVLGRALVMLLLAAPYLLFRFADAIVPTSRGVRRAADVLTLVVVATTALLPELPGDSGPRTVAQHWWFATALAFWAASSLAAGWLLVRGSMGEPGVVRNRLREVETIWVSADRDLLGRPLVNLLSNACKYSDPGTPVSLEAHRDGAQVRVEVRDAGPGVAPEDRVHVFEPFWRGRVAVAQAIRATGIGLALVNEHVAAMVGTVGVETSSEGGAAFWFTVPAAPVGVGDGYEPAATLKTPVPDPEDG